MLIRTGWEIPPDIYCVLILYHFYSMKKSSILLILILIVLNANAQWWKPQHHIHDTVKYIVMYELTLREDTTHMEYYRTDDYMLSIGKDNNISSFRGYNAFKNDMERKKLGDEGLLLELMQTGQYRSKYMPSVHKFDIFKEYEKRIVTTIDHIFSYGMYEYEEPFDSFNWQITSETDTIHNYACQKAICDFGGRVWEAWFTMEIPISDGPYKFCGLPGLILNIADTQDHYSYKFISIEKPSELMMIYEVIEEKIPTTKKEFFKLQDKNKISHSITTMSSNDKSIQKAIEYEKSKNNPIELDRK